MSHAAELDENNIVIRVLVIPPDQEERAHHYLAEDLHLGGRWELTSFTGRIRKNFAGPGFKWDPDRDAFIPPKTFDSWILDEATCRWVAPIPYPEDGKHYSWNEETQTWNEVTHG